MVLYYTEGKAQNTILKVIHTSRERFEKYSFKSFAAAEKYLLSLRNISVNFLHKRCIYGEKVSSYCFEIVSIEDDEDYPINYKYISTKTNFDMDEYRTTGKVVLKDAI